MNIRLASQRDKDQILRLLDESNIDLQSNDVAPEIGGRVFDEVIERKDTLIFIAEKNKEILGLATFYILPNIRHGWHRGHIEDFFVTKDARSKKVGSKIFDTIKEYCRDNKIRVLKLDSGIENIKAHRFYKKNGGKQTEKMFRFDLK